MRLVWTLSCRYTAAMVDTALLLQLLRTPFYTAVRVDAASFFRLLVDAAPFSAVGVGVMLPLLLLLVLPFALLLGYMQPLLLQLA